MRASGERKVGVYPTVSQLDDLVAYDCDSGLFTWRERPVHYFLPGRWGGCEEVAAGWNKKYAGTSAFNTLSTQGYYVGQIFGRQIKAHRAAWALYYGAWPSDQIDHINGVKSDNRILNLRDVDNVENGRNKSLPRNSRSGVVGVYYRPQFNKWEAHIYNAGRRIHLGTFVEKSEAVEARRLAEQELGFHPNHGRLPAAVTP